MNRLPALAVLFALLPRATARAEPISFSYQWSVSPSSLVSGSGLEVGIRLFPGPAGTSSEGNASAPPLAFQLFGPGGNGTLPDAPFTLTLRLTDGPSGISDALTFAGDTSTVLVGPYTAVLYYWFLPGFNDATRDVLLGRDIYHVVIPGYHVVDAPSSAPVTLQFDPTAGSSPVTPASLLATISVSAVPEPSALLLAALGLPPLCIAAWKKGKRPGC